MLEAIIIYYAGVILAWALGIPSKSRYTAFAALLSWLFVAMWIIGYVLRKRRFRIYREMLNMAERDLALSRAGYYTSLSGFCRMLREADKLTSNISRFPELLKYRPDGPYAYWFGTDPHGPDAEKRINILKEILNNK